MLADAELERWRLARASLPVVPALVHTSYLINLASPDADAAGRSLRGLVEELLRTARLGIPYLVVHPGSHGGEGQAAGIRRAAGLLDRALEQQREAELPRILLENTAGQGTSIGHCFEHLRDIIGASRYPDRLGVCFDTCHACAAGYALGSDAEWQSTWHSFDTAIGLDALAAFHLNDSRYPEGSRRDRHQHVGCGALGLAVFHRLVNDPRFYGKPMVIETPKDLPAFDRANLALLAALLQTTKVSTRARQRLNELRELTAAGTSS